MLFIIWIVVGGILGWLASMVMKTDAEQGMILNVVVGIIGGLLGGYLMTLAGFDAAGGGIFFSLITAVLGACLLLFILKLVMGRGRGTRV